MNFRRILSKTSVRSSSSLGKGLPAAEEVSKLQSEIESLKQTIETLKISVESRDAAIGTLAREKEKLYVELKSVQRTNRNLHQQLIDERDIHSKEKEYFAEEITRLSKYNTNNKHLCSKQDSLEEVPSCSSWKRELKAKDEVICNICAKYLKIKSSKQALQKRFEKLQQQSQKVCENVILLLHDNRKELNSILSKLIKSSSVPPSCKNFLTLLKINSNLHYENTQLKVCLSIKEVCEASSGSEEEPKRKERLIEKTDSTKFAKSEVRVNINPSKTNRKTHRCLTNYSKIAKVSKLQEMRQFNSIHKMFSPYFRRKRPYSSEPCLARTKVL